MIITNFIFQNPLLEIFRGFENVPIAADIQEQRIVSILFENSLKIYNRSRCSELNYLLILHKCVKIHQGLGICKT